MGLLDDAIRDHLDLKRRHGATEEEIARNEVEALGPVRRVVSRDDEQADAKDAETAIVADPSFDPVAPAAAEQANGHDLPDAFAPEDHFARPEPEDHFAPPVPEVDRRSWTAADTVDEPFADGEPAAAPPVEEPPAPGEPEATESATDRPAPYDPVDPLFDAPPEPDFTPVDADRASRSSRDHAEPQPDEPLPDREEASAAYRAGPQPLDDPLDMEPLHDEPPELDDVSPPEQGDVSPPEPVDPRPPHAGEPQPLEEPARTEEPPPPDPGPGGSRAAGSEKGASPDVLEETPDFLQETPEHDRLWFEQRPPRDFDFDD